MEHSSPSSLPSPTFDVDVTQTNTADWKYVNEGGATIVFRYAGPTHPVFSGKVLRLRKVNVGQQGQDSSNDAVDPSVLFQREIISQLFIPDCLPSLESACVERAWLESLIRVAEDARPLSRRIKDQLDTTRTRGVLATNLIETSGLSIEIKVKLPISFN